LRKEQTGREVNTILSHISPLLLNHGDYRKSRNYMERHYNNVRVIQRGRVRTPLRCMREETEKIEKTILIATFVPSSSYSGRRYLPTATQETSHTPFLGKAFPLCYNLINEVVINRV